LLTGLIAIAQSDLKRMLAASTSSQLGFMLLAVGAGSPVAALSHLVAHAAMKAALFLGAGIFQHARDSTLFGDLRGTGRAYPLVFGLFVLDGLALAGVPPLAGFWSKDAIEAATLQSPVAGLLLALALVGSGLTGAYVARAFRLLWFGPGERRSVYGLRWMLLGVAGLTVLSVTLGAALQPIARFVGEPLPDNITIRFLGLAVSLSGLAAGWFGLADWLVAPVAVQAARGFRLGNGWIDVAVRPAFVLSRACEQVDRGLYALGPGVGRLAVDLAYAARRFEEADLDGLIAWLVEAVRTLGARARKLQTGFVSRELVLAAAGAAGVFILALAAR
jgi:NADH-quinone oxidoreductase subunit L